MEHTVFPDDLDTGCEGVESRMAPRFGSRVKEREELALTELKTTLGSTDLGGKIRFEFGM